MGSATYNNQNIATASIIDLKKAELEFNKSIELKPDFELALRNRELCDFIWINWMSHIRIYSEPFN